MRNLIYRLTEPGHGIPDERKIFSNRALKVLIVPLFLEQLLEVLVGICDTFMVSYAGEAAVSGVSLVNMFNTVFIFLFSALAAGGAVVVSQYIGSCDKKNADLSAGQLMMIAVVFSVAAMLFSLILNRPLLRLLFGEVDRDVMEACVTYLKISAYSYPAIAVYNAGAAVYRSMGKTGVTMNISLAANGVAQSFWSMAALMGTALGLAFVTVIGQCMGAGDTEAADYYMKKLLRITVLMSVLWNGLILAAAPLILQGYALSEEAADLVLILIVIHNIFNAFLYPFSGALANGLRAAGDVKFTMYVSIFSTIGCRVVFSVLFGIWLDLGVIGVAFAMCLDWMIRAAFFWFRFRSGRWKTFRVIG